MMSIFKYIILIFLLLLNIASADSNVDDSGTEIPRVSTHADIGSPSVITTSSNVFTINEKLIAATNSVALSDFLYTHSMVRLNNATGNSSQSAVSIRGFGENAAANSLILIDGYRLTNPDLSAPDLNAILIPDIESIEVIPGSEGTLYGDQAVGGIIKINTKKPQKFLLKLLAGYGSYNQNVYSAYLADNFLNGLSYQVSGLINNTDNYRDHNNLNFNAFSGRIIYDYTSGSAFIKYQNYTNDFLYPGPLNAEQVLANPSQSIFNKNYKNSITSIYETGIKQLINENWNLLVDYSYRTTQSDGFFYSNFNQNQHVNTLDLRAIGVAKTQTITIGGYFENNYYRFINGLLNNKALSTQENIFIQDSINLTPKAELTLGARQAWQQNNIQQTLNFENYYQNAVTVYELGLSYQLLPNWRLYVRRDGNFRFPKANENLFTPVNTKYLQAQTGISYEAGFEWGSFNKNLKASIYQLIIDNEIAFNPIQTQQQPLGANTNIGATIRDGLAISTIFPVAAAIDIAGEFSYVNPYFSSGLFKNKTIPGVSSITGNLAAYLHLFNNFKIYYEQQYLGDYYAINDNQNINGKVSGVWLGNLGLTFEHKYLSINLRTNNLFNKFYNLYTVLNPSVNNFSYFPAPGRNYLLTLSYKLD